MPETKYCPGCSREKNVSGFYRDRSSSSGFDNRCKDCRNLYLLEWRKRHSKREKIIPESKFCTSCEKVKEASEFNRDKSQKDGLNRKCRDCQTEYRHEHERLLETGSKQPTENKTCSRCQKSKPSSEFGHSKRHKDGLDSICRECINTHSRQYYREYINRTKDTPASKQCSRCLEVKPSSEFSQSKSHKDGLTSHCKDCSSESSKKWLKSLDSVERDIPATKVCFTCNLEKPSGEFYSNKQNKDGLDSSCKSCIGERSKELREANPVRVVSVPYEKQCSRCGITKPTCEFGVDKLHTDGLSSACRDCNNKRLLEWVRGNPEKRKNSYLKYYRLNPDKLSIWKQQRRAREAAVGGSYSEKEWKYLKARYDHTCLMCRKKEPDVRLTPDHVIPISKGGPNYIWNIQPLCKSCNSKKRDKTIDYRPDAADFHIQVQLPFLEEEENADNNEV